MERAISSGKIFILLYSAIEAPIKAPEVAPFNPVIALITPLKLMNYDGNDDG